MSDVIKLHSHDHWHELADYDIEKRTIIRVYQPEVEAYSVATSGHFGTLGKERLIVRIQRPDQIQVGFEGDLEFSIGHARIDWERFPDGQTRFVLSHEDYRREVQYVVPELTGEIWDMYAVELEDFDFGLWVLNIKNSPERQQVILSN